MSDPRQICLRQAPPGAIIRDALLRPVLTVPAGGVHWLLVLDLCPAANLSHPHLWVLTSSTGKKVTTKVHGWPPEEGA